MRPVFHLSFEFSRQLRKAIGAACVCLPFAFSALASSAQAPPVLFPWTINTIAGNGSNGSGGNGGPAIAAQLSSDLRAVAVDGQGNVFFVDIGNNQVRKINAATGIISVVAGGGTICNAAIDSMGDNCLAATQTKLSSPRGLALDNAGNLYIAGYTDEAVHKINAQTGMMTLVAGAVTDSKHVASKGYGGDNGPATVASLNQPRGVRVDNNGDIWICDTTNNVVRKITTSTGIINTVVGSDANGTSPAAAGYAGDGQKANVSSVLLNTPTDIVFDSHNNAYIADFSNKVIRRVDAISNIISTVIGNYYSGNSPTTPPWGTTPGPISATASNLQLGSLSKLAIDSHDNLYFADSSNSIIYFYDAVAKTITPIAGQYEYAGTASSSFSVCAASTDSLGDGCPAMQALLYQGSSALGIAIDGQNNLYITDPGDNRIREVSTNLSFAPQTTGQAATQTVQLHFSQNDHPAASNGVAIASTSNEFTAAAPNCTLNSDSTTNCTVQLSFNPLVPGMRTAPLVVTGVASSQAFPVSGIGSGALVAFDPGTIALPSTSLKASQGAAFDAYGNLYIADTGNNRVVEIGAATQAQTVIAGIGVAGYSGDGAAAASAKLNTPTAVTVSANGTLYIADTGNNVIRAVTNGVISTLAGGASTVCSTAVDAQGDGCPATQAKLRAPAGLITAGNGDLYIADTGDNMIRRLDAMTGAINLHSGTLSSVSCTSSLDNYGDGCPLISSLTVFSGPTGLATDTGGNLYVTDTGNNLVRKLNNGTGTVSAMAGNGQAVFTGDGGPATAASLNAPTAVALDAAGDIYIADTGNAVVRMVASSGGEISTLAGQGGAAGSSGVANGPESELLLNAPAGLAIDLFGNLWIVDTGNNRLVTNLRSQGLLNLGRANVGDATPEQTATVNNLGNQAMTFSGSPFYSGAGDTTEFTIDTSAASSCAGSGTVNAGSNCTLGAAFNPDATGAQSETLTMLSTAVNSANASLQLQGNGVLLDKTKVSLALTSPTGGSLAYGETEVFTATVAATSGSGTPSGKLTFAVDGVQQPAKTLDSTDAVTLTLSQLAVGSHTISAAYSGDDTYAPSSATLAAPVAQATTSTSLTISPTTQIQLQPVAFTAKVTSSTTGVPTGSVNFMSGNTLLATGQLNSQGQATLQTTSLAIASYSVTAVYSGDANYATSTSSTVALTINPIPPGMVVSASSSTLSVPQGGSVQTVLTVTPQGGLAGNVTLSCSGLPANANCTFYPTTLNLGGNPNTVPTCTVTGSSQACTTLTIATNVSPAALQTSSAGLPGDRGSAVLAAMLAPVLLLGFGGVFSCRRRSLPWMMVVGVAVLAGLTMLSGCTSNITQKPASVTPTGTSTITVTFTGQNNVQQTQTLSLTVLTATPVTARVDRPFAVLHSLVGATALSELVPTRVFGR